MAKGSGRLSDFDYDETGGALSGLLAEEDDLDYRALWRLGTWATVSVGAVIVALITNQSSIGTRREQTAAADLVRQTQQVQLAAKETQSEARRLASAVETLNGDRDRLYSRVAVLEQGLDSVTGAIARQNSTPPSPSPQASASPAAATTAGPSASVAPAASSSMGQPTPAAQVAAAPVEPPPAASKPSPAPVVAPVAATTAAVTDNQAPIVASEPSQTVASASQKPTAAQPSGSLMAAKSMMAPPDPAAGKLMEIPTPQKTVTTAPMPEVVAVAPATPDPAEPDSASTVVPETVVKRTEFGVDVGGANSISGLRALWRGLLKSRSNAALTTLRPIIVIKENGNGLGMQLRLVAGPIGDAAAAAKVCAALTVNDRNCTTAVFEGQRLALSTDEQARIDANNTDINRTDANNADPNSAESGRAALAKPSLHKRVAAKHPKEEAARSEPSTLSLIFGKH